MLSYRKAPSMTKYLASVYCAALAIVLGCFSIKCGTTASAQTQGFISVEGSDLKSRFEIALKLAHARSQRTPFWIAYAFKVRPNVVFASGPSQPAVKDQNLSEAVSICPFPNTGREIRNLGAFLKYEARGRFIEALEIYDLDRPHEFVFPVYWLGKVGNRESLDFLRSLTEKNYASAVAVNSVIAIGLHDDQTVGSILEGFVRASSDPKVRETSIFWLGQLDGELPFLASLVLNDQQDIQLRRKAVFAIGASKNTSTFELLRSLYASVSNLDIRRQILFSISINPNKHVLDFLIETATSDPDRAVRKQAVFWLGLRAGNRSADVSKENVGSNEADLSEQAIFAVSRRPKDEAVALLIKIAKTHPKAAVRNQALFWLGQIDEKKALDFYKDLLSK